MNERLKHSELNVSDEDRGATDTDQRIGQLQILIAELLLENQLLRWRSEDKSSEPRPR